MPRLACRDEAETPNTQFNFKILKVHVFDTNSGYKGVKQVPHSKVKHGTKMMKAIHSVSELGVSNTGVKPCNYAQYWGSMKTFYEGHMIKKHDEFSELLLCFMDPEPLEALFDK